MTKFYFGKLSKISAKHDFSNVSVDVCRCLGDVLGCFECG